MPSQNLTIMFTDIKGFTQRVSEGTRTDLADLRSTHERLLVPVFLHFEGKIIKTIGDAFLVTFTSPTDAVMCGLAIQETLRQYNLLQAKNKQLEVRVAINSGEVDVTENDVLGEPVNIAARLEGVSEAGEVSFTEAVYLSMNRSEAPSAEVGERTFKGIPYPVKVYKAIQEANSELAKRLTNSIAISDGATVIKGLHRQQQSGRSSRLAVIGGVVILLLVAGILFFSLPSDTEKALLQAKESWDAGDRTAAYATVSRQLVDDPGDRDLQAFAVQSARQFTEDLVAKQGPGVAHDWLRNELATRTYLGSLQEMIPVLDGQATALKAAGREVTDTKRQEILSGLLSRYPNSAAALLAAAQELQGKVYPYFPLWLYSEAFSRGAAPDRDVFTFCTGLMGKMAPGNIAPAHRLLAEYYPQEALAWAADVFDKDSVLTSDLLVNAWQILQQHKDPRINDPYNQSLVELANGLTGGPEQADRVIAVLAGQTDPFRQEQALNFARKRVEFRSGMMHEVERVPAALEQAFKN